MSFFCFLPLCIYQLSNELPMSRLRLLHYLLIFFLLKNQQNDKRKINAEYHNNNFFCFLTILFFSLNRIDCESETESRQQCSIDNNVATCSLHNIYNASTLLQWHTIFIYNDSCKQSEEKKKKEERHEKTFPINF